MKEIAIIGAGNSGCVTALELIHSNSHYNITMYHSPHENPIEKVGQGSFPSLPYLLINTLGVDWYHNPIDMTIKTGLKYEGWGKKKYEMYYPFDDNRVAAHIVPDKLSKVVLESGLVNVVEKTIQDPEKEIDADYIFDCRGRHNRDKDNYEKLTSAVDSVLLSSRYKLPSDKFDYTRCVATPHGWTFIIPLKDTVSYGYLYNSEVTSAQVASEDFVSRFRVPHVEHQMKFESYRAKNMFVGKRTILQGNAYGFIEPLEATAIGMYQNIAIWVQKYIQGHRDKEYINSKVKRHMRYIETFLLWHYQFGSAYDTPFWEHAKSLTFIPGVKFRDIVENTDLYDRGKNLYGQWGSIAFRTWKEYVIK